ncbi:alpha/beta hydrolase [Neobacillus sp. DY30]|uniref:alpha/beta hydrolase n=1 Tax=Neobacillus sp. DY30 TaxID=3047871 RepID=UPI0024BF6838|nr:alpha/beta hydrolase [Neobacillus sp. DY30]WHX98547.1 alpha/beta hydrolase [Neobacillus sp. DY30]
MPSISSYFFKKGIKAGAKKLKLEEKEVSESRQVIDSFARKFSKLPQNCKVEQLEIEGIYGEWISNHQNEEGKVILYLHGGGYGYCSADTHRTLAARIMLEAGVKVLLPEYRLAPEHPFPAAIDDTLTVYRWLLKQGYDSSNIIFAGDSAGGGLSVASSLVLRDQYDPLPAALVCLSPWVDLTSSGQSYRKNCEKDPYLRCDHVRKTAQQYAGDESLDNHLISPVFADLCGLPPMFIQVGSIEILLSDAEMLAEKARQAGVKVHFKVWEGMWHVWQISAGLPEAKQAVKEIGNFVKKKLI